MIDYASLAQSLTDNEAFQRALADIRVDAIDKLVAADPDDRNGIIRQQAIVAVVDDMQERLKEMIRQGAPKPNRAIP